MSTLNRYFDFLDGCYEFKWDRFLLDESMDWNSIVPRILNIFLCVLLQLWPTVVVASLWQKMESIVQKKHRVDPRDFALDWYKHSSCYFVDFVNLVLQSFKRRSFLLLYLIFASLDCVFSKAKPFVWNLFNWIKKSFFMDFPNSKRKKWHY